MTDFGEDLKGKFVTLWTLDKNFRFSGIVLHESPTFITITDDFDGLTKVFSKNNISALTIGGKRDT